MSRKALIIVTAISAIGLSAAVFSGAFTTSPQAMCSARDVERTLHREWVDMMSNTTFASIMGLPKDAVIGLTGTDIQADPAYKEAYAQLLEAERPETFDRVRAREIRQEMQRIKQRITDEYKASHPTPKAPPTEVRFVSDPVAVEFDPNIERVTCTRQLITNNQFINLMAGADGQNGVTTRYSVQPGTNGGYMVSILDNP